MSLPTKGNTYKFEFTGRQAGALGVREFHIEHASGKNAREALLNLYERFEHIKLHRVHNQNGDTIPNEECY